jgi:hypothetical protein
MGGGLGATSLGNYNSVRITKRRNLMDTFFTMDVQRAAIQTMESLYIIATSKNIETVKGRYDFLLTVLPTLQSAKNNSQYPTIIKMALDQFKTMYPTSVPQDYQLSTVSNPDSFNANDFYCNSLVNAIKRFCEKQSEETNSLKKEGAKTKRISKVIENIKSAQLELESKCSSSSFFPTALNEFNKLADTFAEDVLKS